MIQTMWAAAVTQFSSPPTAPLCRVSIPAVPWGSLYSNGRQHHSPRLTETAYATFIFSTTKGTTSRRQTDGKIGTILAPKQYHTPQKRGSDRGQEKERGWKIDGGLHVDEITLRLYQWNECLLTITITCHRSHWCFASASASSVLVSLLLLKTDLGPQIYFITY